MSRHCCYCGEVLTDYCNVRVIVEPRRAGQPAILAHQRCYDQDGDTLGIWRWFMLAGLLAGVIWFLRYLLA